jgi:adenine deaminase
MTIKGNIVDIPNKKIFFGSIEIENKKIKSISILAKEAKANEHFISAGFIDAHIHIESSMVTPSHFAAVAVTHGTVATISDPHEIANVCGMEGVHFMINNGKQTPFKFHFGAPSCVPATAFETAGATLNSQAVAELLALDDIYYLSEVMNYPGVLYNDPEVMAKIAIAKKLQKPIDGHAPGLKGNDAATYINAGITTDHECVSYDEAKEKILLGMKIIIREGSAAKNFKALIPLLNEYPNEIMFCSDDKHPDDLLLGHINKICARAMAQGIDVFKVLQAACINPIKHYNMKVGALNIGDAADFIVLENLEQFNVLATYIDGQEVFNGKENFIPVVPIKPINIFNITAIKKEALEVKATDYKYYDAIEALDGQLITKAIAWTPKIVGENIESDIAQDILKIAVVNRYNEAPPILHFIKNFGLKTGAIASTVAHDSHNIIAVGANSEDLQGAINAVIATKGGLSVANNNDIKILPLPIAGIMSDEAVSIVGAKYQELDKAAKDLGCTLHAPFMTLSFMALLVIPHLKIGDKGLFDVNKFSLVQ